MNKKLIRLTESDLHRIVRESVNRVIRSKRSINEMNDTNHANLWLRLAVSLDCSMQEADALFNSDTQVLQKIISDGRFELDGESYIPSDAVSEFNMNYGTSFEESDVVFDML